MSQVEENENMDTRQYQSTTNMQLILEYADCRQVCIGFWAQIITEHSIDPKKSHSCLPIFVRKKYGIRFPILRNESYINSQTPICTVIHSNGFAPKDANGIKQNVRFEMDGITVIREIGFWSFRCQEKDEFIARLIYAKSDDLRIRQTKRKWSFWPMCLWMNMNTAILVALAWITWNVRGPKRSKSQYLHRVPFDRHYF